MHASSRPRTAAVAAVLALGAAGSACDEPKPQATAAASTAIATARVESTAAPPPKPKGMPDLLVDPEGPYLGGRRVDLAAATGRDELARVVGELPIEGKPVPVTVEKKAKTPHVAALVAALGKAGAPKVVLKTDGRDDLPKEITVTPESRVSTPPGCSVTAMVLKDLSTAVWAYRGGLAKRQRKGFAGPDLTHTGETIKKEMAACDSTMAFFSSDDAIAWEMTYNLGATVLASDEKKKIDTLVLLTEAPVAGRAVGAAK